MAYQHRKKKSCWQNCSVPRRHGIWASKQAAAQASDRLHFLLLIWYRPSLVRYANSITSNSGIFWQKTKRILKNSIFKNSPVRRRRRRRRRSNFFLRYLRLESMLRMCGDLVPLFHELSWRGDWLRTTKTVIVTLHIIVSACIKVHLKTVVPLNSVSASFAMLSHI